MGLAIQEERAMARLQGKVAVVTGASKGIGAAIAKGIANEGAKVVVNYASDEPGAQGTVNAIKAAGGEAIAVRADISKSADVKSLFAQSQHAFGRLDILVNNAGIYKFENFESVTEEEFHRIYNTNVLGCMFTMQEAIKYFGSEGGNIINIATGGIAVPPPTSSIYTSSKAALVTMSKVLSKEFGSRGIRVNVVAPGATETEGAHAVGLLNGPMVEKLVAATPLGRLGQPDDIVGPVVFLASADSSWVTGEVLFASGGPR